MNDFLLLDTDVASYLFKNSPRAGQFRAFLDNRRLALTFVSVAELFKWALKRNWTQQKTDRLEVTLRDYLILPYDRDMAWNWARVMTHCEAAGRPMATTDAWIASAALRHDLPLLTNNLKHYEAAETICGLKLIRLST